MSEKKKFEHRDFSGTLFKNERRTKESQPIMTGGCMIDGVEYRISVWSKTTATGRQMWSLSFQNADDMYPMGTGNPDVKKPPMPDDEIPF
jgi:hypothetical protein